MVLYKNNTGIVVFMDFGHGLEPIKPGDTIEADAARPMAPLELVLSNEEVTPTKIVRKKKRVDPPPKSKPQLEPKKDEPEELP